MKYEGIKINDELIIVEKVMNKYQYNYSAGKYIEKIDDYPQGYVVDADNSKMLDTAMRWAKTSIPIIDSDGNYEVDSKDNVVYTEHEGIQHHYKNGDFTFELYDEADSSSQGGKLSFWNCILTAKDNKKYKIGINSSLLIEFLKANTFVNGSCQTKVWLGRVRGKQVGVFTNNMEQFKQAKADAVFRTLKSTSKYEIGDILQSKADTYIYLGTITENFTFQDWYELATGCSNHYCRSGSVIVIDKKPVTKYLYLKIDYYNNSDINIIDTDITELIQNSCCYLCTRIAPLKLIITGHRLINQPTEMIYLQITKDKYLAAEKYFVKYKTLMEQTKNDLESQSIIAKKNNAYEELVEKFNYYKLADLQQETNNLSQKELKDFLITKLSEFMDFRRTKIHSVFITDEYVEAMINLSNNDCNRYNNNHLGYFIYRDDRKY